MRPIFDREETLRSPNPPLGIVDAFVTEFAVLGYVDVARDLVSIVNKEYPLHGLEIGALALAWAITKKWPDGTVEEDKTEAEHQKLIEEGQLASWPNEIGQDERKADAKTVERLLALAQSFDPEEADAVMGEDADQKSYALVKALDISIKLAEDKAGKSPLDELDTSSSNVLKLIADRLHSYEQIDALAMSARTWPYLIRGELAKVVGVDAAKVEALGKDVKDTVAEWFSRGPQPAVESNKSIKELLDICSEKTKQHWALAVDEDDEDEQPPETQFNKPASDKDIETLEKRLETTLPKDYKEFLKLSNGFGRILAGEFVAAPLHMTEDVTWTDLDELAGEEDDEDEGDEEDEPDGAPPAKKIKMSSGQAVSASKGGDGGDDGEEDEDEDEDEEALAKTLQALQRKHIELLAVPDFLAFALKEGHDQSWPELKKAVEISSDNDAFEADNLYLIAPDDVKRARDAYLAMYDKVDDTQKKALRWAMIAWAGGEDKFRQLDGWAVVQLIAGEADMTAWPSFTKFLSDMAESAEKSQLVEDEEGDEAEDADKLSGCFAYRCR